MLQLLQAGAKGGGCQVNRAFSAEQYVDGFARRDLGAKAANVKTGDEPDDAKAELPDGRVDDDEQHDGIGDTNAISGRAAAGGCADAEHDHGEPPGEPGLAGGEDAIPDAVGEPGARGEYGSDQLMGEQSRAYAEAQNAASEQRMRSWERRQESEDRQQRSFIQAIREVETWKDSNGSVELAAGYEHAWSRGDGSYLLSNKPGFDPAAALQDSQWKPMQRER